MRSQPLTLERHLAEAESAVPFALEENPTQPLLGEGFQSRPPPARQPASLREPTAGHEFSCFHVISHIT